MKKVKLCQECKNPIVNRPKNTKFCKECGNREHRFKVYRANPIYIKRQRNWANKHRKLCTQSAIEAEKKNKEIISLLRIKYHVRKYGDILDKLKEEVGG